MTRRRRSHCWCGKCCLGLVFLHVIHELFKLSGSSPNLEVLNRNSSAIWARSVECSWMPNFRHMPNCSYNCLLSSFLPRNSRQSFRGRSVQDSSWSRTIFVLASSLREIVNRRSFRSMAPLGNELATIIHDENAADVQLDESAFLLLSHTNRRAQRSTSGLLPLALSAFSLSSSCVSCCSMKSSIFCPSPSLVFHHLLILGIGHIYLFGYHHVQLKGEANEFGLPRKGDAAFGVLAHLQLEHNESLCAVGRGTETPTDEIPTNFE